MKFWIILAVSFVVTIGLINYLLAVVRAKKNATGKFNNALYVIVQVLISVLYLLPTAAVLLFGAYVYFNPVDFIDKDWFVKSLVGYFAVIALITVIGIVLLKKQVYRVYDKDDVFMYAIKPRAIISFIMCALGVAVMVFGIINVDVHRIKEITAVSQIEQYADQKYLAIDISKISTSYDSLNIVTSEKCQTLLIYDDKSVSRNNVMISTSAGAVTVEGLSCKNSDEKAVMVFNDDIELSFNDCNIQSASISFLGDASLSLTGTKISGSLDFRGKADIKLDSSSTSDCKIVCEKTAKIATSKGIFKGSVYFNANGTIETSSNGVDLSVTVTDSCNNLTFNGSKPNKDSDTDDTIATNELSLNITVQERTDDLVINLNNAILKLGKTLQCQSKLKIKSDGNANQIIAAKDPCALNIDKIYINVDGDLTLKSQVTKESTATIVAQSLFVSGKGSLSVYGPDGAYGGYTGGNAVISKTMTLDGNDMKLVLYGGTGGVGRTGSTGYTGAKGKKGNNESQGKDSVYGYDGRPGGKGGKGGTGEQGGIGGAALVIDEIPVVSANSRLVLCGGNGGQGGKGGTGGRGGDGGDGGDDDQWSFIWIGDMSGGNGGPGGPGGDGGDGGIGGEGATSLIVAGEVYTMDSDAVTQTDGTAGEIGLTGDTGYSGSYGAHGDDGIGG